MKNKSGFDPKILRAIKRREHASAMRIMRECVPAGQVIPDAHKRPLWVASRVRLEMERLNSQVAMLNKNTDSLVAEWREHEGNLRVRIADLEAQISHRLSKKRVTKKTVDLSQ